MLYFLDPLFPNIQCSQNTKIIPWFLILCCSQRKTKFECRCFSTELGPLSRVKSQDLISGLNLVDIIPLTNLTAELFKIFMNEKKNAELGKALDEIQNILIYMN